MINCAICRHEMPPNGANLYSPPISETPMPASAVTKYHICRECYTAHIEPILTQPLGDKPETKTSNIPPPKETPMDKNVFRINLKCSNCGAAFSKDFPAGIHVWLDNTWRGIYVREDQNKTRIACPICKTDDELKILSREPIEKPPSPRERYIPRPTITDEALVEIFRETWEKEPSYTLHALARAARKALLGEEAP